MTRMTPSLRFGVARFAIIPVAAMLLAACSTASQKAPHVSDAGKRAEVNLTRLTHVVKFGGQTTLPATEAAAINAFIANNRVGFGDTISVDVSGGSAVRRAAVAEQLRLNGLTLAPDTPVLSAAPQPGTAVLIVDRYVVTPPKCPDWSRANSPNYQNISSSNFGCATQTNLSMMVANPHDLVQGESANGTAIGEAATRPLDTLHKVTRTQGVTQQGLRITKTQ